MTAKNPSVVGIAYIYASVGVAVCRVVDESRVVGVSRNLETIGEEAAVAVCRVVDEVIVIAETDVEGIA
jgi:hypothetical protein